MKPGDVMHWAPEPCLMGIDEAGRGPVLGSMVYGAAFCPMSQAESLKGREFADSKTLTDEKREQLFDEIEAASDVAFAVDAVTAADISAYMLRSERISLNVIAWESTVRLVQGVLQEGVNVKEVFCDTVGDPNKWRESLERKFNGIKFTVCPKADALYPIVSAASIVAKVTRDREIKGFKLEAGMSGKSSLPLGSGYPSDPVTVNWLKNNIDPVFGYPNIVRFSWQTTIKLLEEHAADVKWECEAGSDLGQKRLSFSQTEPSLIPMFNARHSYFQARQMHRVASF